MQSPSSLPANNTNDTAQVSSPRILAALDLGSNSFHMVIAEEDARGGLHFIDRVKEMVRLNAGLDEQGNLSEDSQQVALECLRRFRQRLKNIPPEQLRAVGTNTFRAAHNAEEFLQKAEQELGHHISIISGHEEARLVYLGASFSLETSGRKRLVIDIGGGSTELIVGRGIEAMTMASLYMGCVSMSRRFFPDRMINRRRIRKARSAAMLELEPVIQEFSQQQWQQVVGASGTIRSVDDLSRALGLESDWISMDSFSLIEDWLVEQGSSDRLELVSEQRRPVFVGGFAIISAIFEVFSLKRIQIAGGALREGVLYDLNGRLHDQDSRDHGVAVLGRRFKLDHDQAERVSKVCSELWQQVKDEWQVDQIIHQKMLGWAANLHEIGINIAYNQNHKHGSYIIENSDIDGFSRHHQRTLALLVRSHRQKFPHMLFDGLPASLRQSLFYLAVLLRLGVAFSRGRTDTALPSINLSARPQGLTLHIAKTWCEQHPLTVMDIQSEQHYLSAVGFDLKLEQVQTQ